MTKPKIPLTPMTFYKVEVIESERGWGQKVDDVQYFATKEQATKFQSQQNAQNNQMSAPDIYWRAENPVTITVEGDLLKLIIKELNARRKKANETPYA